VPNDVEPKSLVRGPDGNLWFTGVRGRGFSEHGRTIGVGYVGRMSPAGDLALFQIPIEESAPAGIAVGPDGNLRFVYATNASAELGTIATDGTFGPSVKLNPAPLGELTFGPEGDAWVPTFRGLARITPEGQETLFPGEWLDVATGVEGDIWVLGRGSIRRIDPAAVVPSVPRSRLGAVSAERGTGEMLVLRPGSVGDDLDAVTPALTGAFVAAREALEAGRPVAVVLDARDLLGQGSPLDAAVATGLLGMVRTLGIEGVKPGWRVNVVAGGEGDEAVVEETVAMLAGSSLTGQLLQVGGANLGKVVP
jgi:hypothetical protein